MSEAVIDVQGLTKRFGDKAAVDDFSIRVAQGQIYGFLGPNGSGKTTTIRMLCGLLTPDAGEGHCLGYDIRSEAQRIKREVGYMTQRFSLYEDLSIAENLDFVARMYAVRERKKVVEQTIDRLGLTARRRQLAGTLSGGWKQRVALAACMLHSPRLLRLDEPTAGVDPKARREFWDRIHELAAEGLTVLVSTHYMDEAERCHELAYLAYGHLMVNGTAQEVVRQSGLATWAANGEASVATLNRLGQELRALPAVRMVVPFGNTLHVSGEDEAALEAAIAPYRERGELVWKRIKPSLEDVFISLMNRAKDNMT